MPSGLSARYVRRDPAVTRDSPPAMLTFGGGAHYCLGTLARLELTQALTVITRRMPNARRGPAPWNSMTGITGPTTLPIEFDTGY
jgi:cytochrome P450